MLPSLLVRRVAGASLLAFTLAVAGCGPARSTVTGSVVTSAGKIVPLGTVNLVASDGSPHSAQIQEDGTYTIQNVPVGLAKIGVTSPNPTAPPPGERPRVDPVRPPRPDGGAPKETGPAYSEAAKKAWFAISDALADPLSSKLTVQVVSGTTKHDIKVD